MRFLVWLRVYDAGGVWGDARSGRQLNRLLKKDIGYETRPRGLKPATILRTLRGAEAPLFDVATCTLRDARCHMHSESSCRA